MDRANTTGQVFLGLTVGCAQCHDHKYDPISQREYYQLYAFFNSVQDEIGAGGASGYHNKPLPPLLKVETEQYKKELSDLTSQTKELESELAPVVKFTEGRPDNGSAGLCCWLKKFQNAETTTDTYSEDLQLWLAADDINGDGVPGCRAGIRRQKR